jgi:hypothetical protein
MASDFDSPTAWHPWFRRVLAVVAKTHEGWRKFGIVAGYLLVFYLVMRFVFKAKRQWS